MAESETLVGGVDESHQNVFVRLVAWMPEYCLITLYSPLVPNCAKNVSISEATGFRCPPASAQDGPQKIATCSAFTITGPPWLIRFWPPPPPGFAHPGALSFEGKSCVCFPFVSTTRWAKANEDRASRAMATSVFLMALL